MLIGIVREFQKIINNIKKFQKAFHLECIDIIPKGYLIL